MKKLFKIFFIGVFLVILVGGGLFVGMFVKNFLRIRKEQTTVHMIEFDNDDRIYESKYGWKIQVPEGWGRREISYAKAELLTIPDGQIGDPGWTYVAIEPIARFEEVDAGGAIPYLEEFFVGEEGQKTFPNAELVQPSAEHNLSGGRVYEFLFDHDFKDVRIRQYRRYLYPPTGDGWMLYTQARVDDWDALQPTILTTMNSFTIGR